MGGGTKADSEISIATKHYTEHIESFEKLLINQINLIEPTVVICLGRHNGACISELSKKASEQNIIMFLGLMDIITNIHQMIIFIIVQLENI